ncbi:hypothetical protein I3J27_15390 [Bradyrhizobium xenonodulans]|uniref:Uncharacterized protein n=1 Tax=Bradyrhizobium xenonodulans TaxID=2736875 RepID=A0ABY7MVU5_9BRAD|nr:hypothetical protein [Bradyrhizobium xenonodulans]WBL81731.1 hypothetical protein I3J27_15390 [Bradyrhizobium xenonodulans]
MPEQTIVALFTGATGVQAASARPIMNSGAARTAGARKHIDRHVKRHGAIPLRTFTFISSSSVVAVSPRRRQARVTDLLRSEEADQCELDSLNAKVERVAAPDLDGSDRFSAQNEPMPFRGALMQSCDIFIPQMDYG